MKCKMTAFTLLLLSFILHTSVSAKNLKIEEISSSLDAIQVGAFKERKNILYQNKLFYKYNTFVEYGDKLNKFYIVNIKKDAYDKVLTEVKKSAPSAFMASKKIRKMLKKHMPNMDLSHERKVQVISPQEDSFLDSNTILKTRKKFF